EHSLGVNVSEIEAPYTLTNRTKAELVRELRHKLSEIPGTNIEIGQPISHRIDAMLSGTEAQIAIKVFGDDLEQLHKIGNKIKSVAKEIPGVVDINVEQQTGRPQIDIRPRREMLARYGITNAEFNQFITTMIGGEVLSQVYVKGLPYDLTLKLENDSKASIDNLKNLIIVTPMGNIPLGYVADIVSTTGPNTINRENVSRRLVISANVDGRDLRSTVNDLRDEIEKDITLPEGYHISYGGQFESEAAASRTLALASLGALVIILMLLFQEYKNLTQSLIILLNMPLAMIGGILLLKVTSGELNIPAIIGFISLLGISTRNGMLLMSRYNTLSSENKLLKNIIIEGSTDRLNPIIMTALTSALALIPLAIRGSEPGNEIQSPMAIVILGGLVTSTILNIFVVPIIYSLSKKK
ncbi:MAG: efflux RND transporter permease subunit, partial [Paramuribaculum sp.]|nr:efflux RND transporter permease subunit [Paramuribaculum sp.]